MVHRFSEETIKTVWTLGGVIMEQLHFNYNFGKGKISINLENFFKQRSISKFRKLLKIINTIGDTPDETISHIKEFIVNYIEQIEPMKKMYAHSYFEHKQIIPGIKEKIENATIIRTAFKRNSKEYREITDQLKEYRKELSKAKAQARGCEKSFNNYDKMKEFMNQCLDEIRK